MINLRNWAITPTFGYLISMEGLGWLGWGGGGYHINYKFIGTVW